MGVPRQFLHWIMNYSVDRQQYVQIDDKRSEKLTPQFGVPKGSILGPVLFSVYVADQLESMCNSHQYADDTTIYTSVKPTELQQGIERINSSLKTLVVWYEQSKLALQNDKIEAMLITTPQMASYTTSKTLIT